MRLEGFRRLTPLALALALQGAAAPAVAAVVDITGHTGSFVSATASNGTIRGVGTAAIDWGRPSTRHANNTTSGYLYEAVTGGWDSGSFLLGTYTHRNGTIYRGTGRLASTDLRIAMEGRLMGQAFSFDRTVRLVHDETLDKRSNCAAQSEGRPCHDHVEVGPFASFMTEVTQGTIRYRFYVEGFRETVDGPDVDRLTTREGTTNSIFLFGRITTATIPEGDGPDPDPEPVPLPPGGLLLLSALAGGVLLRRRSAGPSL